MTAKVLPLHITSYDLFKTFAVVVMIIDHIGVYFFPDDLWWRAIGRLSFPVWFFLVGYAQSRDFPKKLFIGAGVLIGANFVVGMNIFPFNVLVTIIVIRLMIDPLMAFARRGAAYFWGVATVLFLAIIPTYGFSEFGSLGVLSAMFGYMVRNSDAFDAKMIFRFMMILLVVSCLVGMLAFGFSMAQFVVMAFGAGVIRLMLLDFKAETYPVFTQRCGTLLTRLIQLCGRKTLEIYVVHLIVFKVIALLLAFEGYALFQWTWQAV